ncbi:hypothetical protein ISX56_28275, partial [Serratia ureilytica]|nr:hypothetical protein [Serratia ureilytica]
TPGPTGRPRAAAPPSSTTAPASPVPQSLFPLLVAAPRYFSGAIQMGGLMQIASAFGQVQGALSWFIDAFNDLATWKACVNRLAGFNAAYLIRHLDLPGFTPAQKKLLATLLQNQSNTLDLSLLNQQNALPPRTAQRLCRILRLAIIFASRRRDLNSTQIKIVKDQLKEVIIL